MTLLTLADVALALSVSRRTVERLVAAGRIRVVRPSAGVVRVEPRELDAYIAAIRRAA